MAVQLFRREASIFPALTDSSAYYTRIDSKLDVLIALFAFRHVLVGKDWYAATISFY